MNMTLSLERQIVAVYKCVYLVLICLWLLDIVYDVKIGL